MMTQFKLKPVVHAIGVAYGLWTATPMAISQQVLKKIKGK